MLRAMMTSRRLPVAVMLLIAASGCSKNETPTAPTTACTVTAGAISASTFGAAGGTGSVPITGASGCAWTATSSATFVTISAASGSGNGTASFAVAANTGAARTATLTIAGTTFTISQSAATATTPGSLSAPTATSPVGGQAVTVTRPPLTVSNATATGTVGAVTYRFEISDQPTFPNDAVRTFSIDGVAQGAGTTTGTVNRDLGSDVLWYWHARATDGTVTSAYSATETFRTGSACAFVVSPTTAAVGSSGGTVTLSVTAGATCAWTATSNSSFITVTSGASGTGNGTVTATVAAGAGVSRTGSVTVAGLTVTITQDAGAGIAASFRMLDPATSSSVTTECRINSAAGSTCRLESTSFPLGTNGLSSYSWRVQWTDGDVVTRTQDGAASTFSFSWTCGGPASTTDGAAQPLAVTLTVTDTNGNTATVSSGSGSQPPLFIRLFTC
jgi:hypothetical protein